MIRKILMSIVFISGVFFILMLGLSFTSVPFYMHYNLGTYSGRSDSPESFTPDKIVMFGGAGMPSPDNLMRLYHTSKLASHFDVPVVLVHPEDSICQSEMTRILNQNGITDIMYVTRGTNTRSQVLELKDYDSQLVNESLIVVTSTEHLFRTMKCLEKVGFENLLGVPAQEATVDFNLSLENQKLGGNTSVPLVENTKIRYTFFNYMKLEIICIREYISIVYYKLKNWI